MRLPRAKLLSGLAAVATGLIPLSLRAEPVAAADHAVDQSAAADPDADRVLIMPTALTQPKNTFTISDYQIVVLALTYGITDRLQASVETVALSGSFVPNSAMATVKWQLLRAGNVRMAAMAGLSFASIPSYDPRPEGERAPRIRLLAPQAGLVTSFCFTDDCQSLLTANLHLLAYNLEKLQYTTVAGSLSATVRLTKHFKLLAELNADTLLASGQAIVSPPLVGGGVRVFGGRFAGELGVMAVPYIGVYPIPFLSGTVRL